jgi:AraC-like DNA-binding protein
MSGLPHSTPTLTFSTRGVPEQSRQDLLHGLSEQGLLPVTPLRGCVPQVDLVKWRLPGISVLSGTFAGVRQGGRCVSSGDAGLAGADDDLFFGINVAGGSLARQCGRDVVIGTGDAVAADPDAGVFTILRPEHCRMIGLRVTRRAMPPEILGERQSPLRLVPGRTPALQLLTRYMRSVLQGPAPASAQLADAVTTHVTDLIQLSLSAAEPESLPSRDQSVRAARMSAIKADIERSLTDSALTTDALAARHGISTRYLHMLFEREPLTYSQFVLERRLSLAYERLRSPRYASRTIASIAADAGFADLSYFNRTFRRRYSITPSELRRMPSHVYPDPG